MKRTSITLNPETYQAAQEEVAEKRQNDRRVTFSSYIENLIRRDLERARELADNLTTTAPHEPR